MSKIHLELSNNKWISRKLFVFINSTVSLFYGQITSDNWMVLATAYISIQGITDMVKSLLATRKGTEDE